MPSSKPYAFGKKIFTEIPAEIVDAVRIRPGDELEFKTISDNSVAFVVKKSVESPRSGAGGTLGERELAVLKKINNIMSFDRTPERVAKILSADEKKLFDRLLAERTCFLFRKEGKERVGISRDFLPLVIAKTSGPAQAGKKPGVCASPLVERLLPKGFVVLENQRQAQDLTDRVKSAGKDAEVRGTRGFDKKFYIISSQKLSELEQKFFEMLQKEKSLKAIAKELCIEEDLAKTAVEVLREDGKVIEKRKDLYALA